MTSTTTKKYRIGAAITGILSALCVWGPLIFYAITGWSIATNSGKFVLCSGLIFALIVTAINVIFKYHFRSAIFIIIIILTVVFQNALTLIIVFAVLQVVDELILTPIHKYCRNKASINYEIDKRIIIKAD